MYIFLVYNILFFFLWKEYIFIAENAEKYRESKSHLLFAIVPGPDTHSRSINIWPQVFQAQSLGISASTTEQELGTLGHQGRTVCRTFGSFLLLWPTAGKVGQIKIESGLEEAAVWILFHQVENLLLSLIKAGYRRLQHVTTCLLPGARVQVYLRGRVQGFIRHFTP